MYDIIFVWTATRHRLRCQLGARLLSPLLVLFACSHAGDNVIANAASQPAVRVASCSTALAWCGGARPCSHQDQEEDLVLNTRLCLRMGCIQCHYIGQSNDTVRFPYRYASFLAHAGAAWSRCGR